MNREQIEALVSDELARAKAKHPNDQCTLQDFISFMMEESGEAVRAVNQYRFEDGPLEEVTKELVQTVAVCYRILEKITPNGFNDLPENEDEFDKIIVAVARLETDHRDACSVAMRERKFQVDKRGYTPDKDDQYVNDELLFAGLAYLYNDVRYWPFGIRYFKPDHVNMRGKMRKAAGLLLADWQRIYRKGDRSDVDRAQITVEALSIAIEVLSNIGHDEAVLVFNERLVPVPDKDAFVAGSPLSPRPVFQRPSTVAPFSKSIPDYCDCGDCPVPEVPICDPDKCKKDCCLG